MEEMELSFKDIALKIFLKWRFFLSIMLVCGIMFGIIGFAKKTDSEIEIQDSNMDISLDSLKSVLEESAQLEIELAAEKYLTLKAFLEEKEKHLDHSIKMKIDYEKVPSLSVTYYVELEEQIRDSQVISEDSSDIIDLYFKKVLNNDTYKEILTELGENIDYICVSELIEVEKGAKDLFTVKVIASNKDEVEIIASIVKNRLEESTKSIKDSYGEHNITCVDEMYSDDICVELLQEKQTRISEIQGIRSEMAAIDDVFGVEGVAYFDALINGDKETTKVQENSEGTEISSSIASVNYKYILVGFVIGGFIALAFVIIKYVCSTCLRNSEEITKLTGVKVLGNIHIDDNKKRIMHFVDQYIYRIFGFEENKEDMEIDIISSNIRVAANKKKLQKVSIVTTCNDESVEKLIEKINYKIESDIFECHKGLDVLRNAEMLEKMLMTNGVIIVEKENTSKRIDVKKIVELCDIHQVPVIGAVVLKEN